MRLRKATPTEHRPCANRCWGGNGDRKVGQVMAVYLGSVVVPLCRRCADVEEATYTNALNGWPDELEAVA